MNIDLCHFFYLTPFSHPLWALMRLVNILSARSQSLLRKAVEPAAVVEAVHKKVGEQRLCKAPLH